MTTASYPSEILVERWTEVPPRASVHVPGSKSLTNRALVVAALAQGPSLLRGALDCEDTQVMVAALRNIGIDVRHDTASAPDHGSRLLGCHPLAPRIAFRCQFGDKPPLSDGNVVDR
jgi:hypothetical protein